MGVSVAESYYDALTWGPNFRVTNDLGLNLCAIYRCLDT